MAWATAANIITTNLDSNTDSPAAARVNIKAALDELVIVINGRGQVSGVAPLNASTKIDATYLPDEINSSAVTPLTLDPATGKVLLEEILNLEGYALIEVICPFKQDIVPSSSAKQNKEGKIVSQPLENMSPFLSKEEFEQEMIVKIHK